MPHAVCWAASPALVWTMVITNLITFLSYFTICLVLLSMVRKTRRVIARDWAWFVVGFALFIVACGSTHLFEVITTWIPVFWMDATANVITAVLSAGVAVMLMRRAGIISWSINDYADRLMRSEEERAAVERSLLSARKLEDWSRLSAAVAHEIANPIESIQNMLYLIRSAEGASSEIVDLATSAADEADRVITISRSTLTFFREGGDHEMVDVRAAVESVRFVLQGHLQKKQLQLALRTRGDGGFEAMGQPGEFRQVLLNLVRNAVEATPDRGDDIEVELVGEPHDITIHITDHGTGIPADRMPTLFHFGQTTKGTEGNGVGLWTVRHIVERHGGTVTVDSTVGKGTMFTVCWPRVPAPHSPNANLG